MLLRVALAAFNLRYFLIYDVASGHIKPQDALLLLLLLLLLVLLLLPLLLLFLLLFLLLPAHHYHCHLQLSCIFCLLSAPLSPLSLPLVPLPACCICRKFASNLDDNPGKESVKDLNCADTKSEFAAG